MKKYKIIVLSDLGSGTDSALKSAISLAKMINGEIALFTVKKPIDIVEKENQLSAMRTINSQHTLIDKKIRNLIAPLSKDYGVPIKQSFVFGNVKNEIDRYIKESRPDIIVMGKKKSKPFDFIGDGIVQFVLNSFKGAIMIAKDKNGLEPDKDISLGVLNASEPSYNLEFAEDLLGKTQKPMKSFKIVRNTGTPGETNVPSSNNSVEYIFEHNNNTVKNLSKYLSKSKTDLLFVDRRKESLDKRSHYKNLDLKDVVNTLNVTLMVAGKQNMI